MADFILLDYNRMDNAYKRTLRDFIGLDRMTDIKRLLGVRTTRRAYEVLDVMYRGQQRERQYRQRRQFLQRRRYLQEVAARRIQRAFRGRGVPVENWIEVVRQKLQNLFGAGFGQMPLDNEFTLILRSTEAVGVSRRINFDNFYQFERWVELILNNQVEGDSATIVRYRDIIGEVGDVFRNSRLEVRRVEGGCSQKGRGGERELKGKYNHYRVINPQVQQNNCALKCLEILLDIKLNYTKVRKDFGLKHNEYITTDTLKQIYHRYNEQDKFLNIIDRDFPNVMDFTINNYIIHENNHYRAVLSAKGQKGAFKKNDKRVRRTLLAYDIETRILDHSKGIKTGQSYRYPQIDTITSIHYETRKGKGGKEKEYTTKTFTTTDPSNRSIRQFADWLKRESLNGRHYTIVAHNGSRFDNLFFQSVLTEEEKLHSDFQYRGYSLIGMCYMNHIFRDPCCFLIGSLDTLCKNFKIKNAKMTDNIFIGNDTYLDNKQLCFYQPDLNLPEFLELQQKEPLYWKAYVEYCEMDCISLLELYSQFVRQTQELIAKMGSAGNDSDGKWLLKKCCVISKTTIGGLARKLIDNLSQKSKTKEMYDEFIGEDEDKYKYVCEFKRGGISHCNQAGKHEHSVGSIDITSQYPAALMNMYIPVGRSSWVDTYDPDLNGFYTIHNMKWGGGNHYKFKPVCPSPQKGEVLNWCYDWNEETILRVDSEMLKYLIDYCGLLSFEVEKGLVSKKRMKGSKLFGWYVDTLFEEKKKQDRLKGTPEYNNAFREVCKLFMNSLTGKLVEDTSKYFQIRFTPKPQNPKDNLGGIGFNKSQEEQRFNLWVVAGVMVYSYSKRLLWEYVRYLPNNSDSVIHIETDGIYTHADNLDYLQKQIEHYNNPEYPIAFGEDLGNVKIEHISQGESYWLGKKFYYMYDKGDVMRVKGLPQKTIDKWGNTKHLIDKSFYEQIYEGKQVSKEFSTIYKRVFGQIEMSSLTMSRTIRPMMPYKLYQ